MPTASGFALAVATAGYQGDILRLIADGVSRFRGSAGIPDEERARILDRVRRRLEETAAAEAERLDRNLSLLATTGAVTPFTGLFGAIPAVVGYNLLLARARRLGGRIDRFVLGFASIAEMQIEAGRAASAAVEAGKIRV